MKKFIVIISIFMASALAYATGTKISALPAATSIGGSDTTLLVQGGVNMKAPVSMLTQGLLASDLLNKIKTVDGIGSGLDADLFQGRQANTFQNSSTAINTHNINAQTVANSSQLNGNYSSFYAPILSPAFSGVPTAVTATPGTTTNQLATTQFVASSITGGNSFLPNGYQKFPSGLIIQWGTSTVPYNGGNGQVETLNFAIPFPSTCLNVSITSHLVSGTSSMWELSAMTTSNVSVVYTYDTGGADSSTWSYVAIGY
jgi:hypothetical protein